MASDRELVQLQAKNLTRLAAFSRNLQQALEQINAFAPDGFTSSVIGASDPVPGPPIIYEGTCNEFRLTPIGNYATGGAARRMAYPCNKERPCPDHDAPVHLSVLEQAALSPANHDRTVLEQFITDLDKRLVAVLPVLARNQPPQPELPPTKLCTGGKGHEGHITGWGSAGCHELVEKDGLCLRHLNEEDGWRRASGLEPLDRTYMRARGTNGRFTAA